MAENPASRFSASLNDIVTSREQKNAIEVFSDALWRESWAHHCDHMDRHLDAISVANPDDKEIQARVAFFREIVTEMRTEGMPAIAGIADAVETPLG